MLACKLLRGCGGPGGREIWLVIPSACEKRPDSARVLVRECHGGDGDIASLQELVQPGIALLVPLCPGKPSPRIARRGSAKFAGPCRPFADAQHVCLVAARRLGRASSRSRRRAGGCSRSVWLTDRGHQRARRDRADAGDLLQFAARIAVSVRGLICPSSAPT